jgi:hypothetical protein
MVQAQAMKEDTDKKREFLKRVTLLRERSSPEAGVSCLIHQVRSTSVLFIGFGPGSVALKTVLE